MTDRNKYQKLVEVIVSGDLTVTKELFVLYAETTDILLKLEIAELVINSLSSDEASDSLIKLAKDAVTVAEAAGSKRYQAYFMIRQLNLMLWPMARLRYRRDNLRMLPEIWLGFATEAQKKEYENISDSFTSLEREMDRLMTDSLRLSQEIGDKHMEGLAWIAAGDIRSHRYMYFKGDLIARKSPLMVKLWRWCEFLRRHGLENHLFFGLREMLYLRNEIRHFIADGLRAAKILHDVDESLEAEAFFHIANNLKSAFRFRTAKKYLMQANAIARRLNDQILLERIASLHAGIQDRNRNIPDYINSP